MNKVDYLNKKKLLLEQEQQLYSTYRDRCFKCYRSQKNCLCSLIKRVETKSHFCILMHPLEYRKEKLGTGRATHLSLPNSQIIVGEEFNQNLKVQQLINNPKYAPFLLYPGKESLNTSKNSILEKFDLKNKIPVFFIIDGTWSCAKSMMRRSSILHHIPRVSFDNSNQSSFKIKQQPGSLCLSTIESVHILLKNLQRSGLEENHQYTDNLPKILEHLVQFQIKCAQDPSLPSYRKGNYKLASEKKPSKKWQTRKIFFE